MIFFQTDTDAEIILKENVNSLHFSREDVLTDITDRQRRRADADRAVTLGNAYHGKLDIYFQTSDGELKRMVTTVWAADAAYLTLKSGAFLPMRAVVGFDFY